MGTTIPKTESFWEDPPLLNHNSSVMSQTGQNSNNNNPHLQYERNLNFSTVSVSVDDNDYGFQKKKSARDPLSHRIIEKRRRDRMNNCLADLARLLPQASLRKGRGRIEKTEIVELAIKHLKHLQSHPCPHGDNCEFSPLAARQGTLELCSQNLLAKTPSPGDECHTSKSSDLDQFRHGYQECLKETMHFLVERKGAVTGDNFYVQLVDYLNRHADSVIILSHNNNEKLTHGFFRHSSIQDASSDVESELYSTTCRTMDGNSEIDQKPLSIGFEAERHEKDATGGGEYSHCIVPESIPTFDYDGDNNSCSSTPLSIEISEVNSLDGKPRSYTAKPPVPSIIGSHSSFSSAVLSSSNGRSSDEGSASTTSVQHRYKFKNTIKQRFTADLQTTPDSGTKHHHRYHYHHRTNTKSNKEKIDDTSSSNPSVEMAMDDEHDGDGMATTDVTEVSDEKQNLINSSSEFKGDIEKEMLLDSEKEEVPQNTCELKSEKVGPKSAVSVTNSVAKLELRDSKSPRNQKLTRGPNPNMQEGSGGVPAFALHSNGLFYVPFTLDKSSMAPYTSAVDMSNTPLHPVTISVCFLLNSKEEDLGIHRHPMAPEGKFSDLSIQNPPEALNLSKLSPTPPLVYPTGANSAIFSPHSNSNYIANRFTHSPSNTQSRQHNSSPGIKYQQPMNLHNNSTGSGSPHHHHFQNPKSGSPHPNNLFPYEFPNSRLIVPNHIFSHNHSLHSASSSSTSSNFSGTPITRTSRKRHLATTSTSSSISAGYHSWRGNHTIESTSDEANMSNYTSGGGSFSEESSTLGHRPKSYHHGGSPGLSKRAGSPSKRQRKSNTPRGGGGGSGDGSNAGKSLIIF